MQLETGQQAPPAGIARSTAHERPLADRRQVERLRQIVILIILTIGAITMLVPFEWMLATSLSRSANSAMPRIPTLWPADPSFFNYKSSITRLPIATYYLNSLIVTSSATVGLLLFSSMAGYAFAKGRFPGKSALFVLLLTTLMIPFEMRMVPMYLEIRDMHLDDNLLALILPFVACGFGTCLMPQYISRIPDDLLDAARMDVAISVT